MYEDNTINCEECQEEIIPIVNKKSNEAWGTEIYCECSECQHEFEMLIGR